ncbi:MAG: Na/Pi cotransporter family protein [Butyrivibrio sp.]|nr:Na/Pi cotransporter family protein [Butyrivibrio sp.]
MDIFDILNMIGGLALFLYGMNNMGNGLSKMAGSRLEGILEKLTSRRLYAVLLGAGVTAVIQSSSATTVMVVGFVNSGIMKLTQAVGIIMGANIGTTITSWMLSLTGIQGDTVWIRLLKPSSFSPVLAAIGIVLVMASKNEDKKKDIGGILLGFAILMFGMETMSSSVSGLADNSSFTQMMTAFSNPILGMVIGALLTAIIQSSSASVGILQALCSTGAVGYNVAIPIIMGQNIGTCVTSIISSVGANKNAKRAAMIHLYFNLIGTAIFMVVFYSINMFVNFAFLKDSANAAGIAVVHSLFNICATIVLYPFADKLVRLAEVTISGKASEELNVEKKGKAVMLDERFLESPAFAVEICKQKIFEMAEKTKRSIILATETIGEFDANKVSEVIRLEDEIDDYEDVLGSYLVKLSGKNLSNGDNQSLTQMLHSISDFERISDHAMNIVESLKEMNEKGYSFSPAAKREMNVLCTAIGDIVGNTTNVFIRGDIQEAKHIEPLEEVIDNLTTKIKAHHIKRMQKGKCSIVMGIILEDLLINLERVSDHCSNIAAELMTINENGYETHELLDDMPEERRTEFKEEYKELKKKYPLKKEDDKIKDKSKKEKKTKKK